MTTTQTSSERHLTIAHATLGVSAFICAISLLVALAVVAERKLLTVKVMRPRMLLVTTIVGCLWVLMISISGWSFHVLDLGVVGCRAMSVLTYTAFFLPWATCLLWRFNKIIRVGMALNPVANMWDSLMWFPTALMTIWAGITFLFGFETTEEFSCAMLPPARFVLVLLLAFTLLLLILFRDRAHGIHPIYGESQGAIRATKMAVIVLGVVGLLLLWGEDNHVLVQSLLVLAASIVVLVFTLGWGRMSLAYFKLPGCTTAASLDARDARRRTLLDQLIGTYTGETPTTVSMMFFLVETSRGVFITDRVVDRMWERVKAARTDDAGTSTLSHDDDDDTPIDPNFDAVASSFETFLAVIQFPEIWDAFAEFVTPDARPQAFFLSMWMQFTWHAWILGATHGRHSIRDRKALQDSFCGIVSSFLTLPTRHSSEVICSGTKEDTRINGGQPGTQDNVAESMATGHWSKRSIYYTRAWGCIRYSPPEAELHGHPYAGSFEHLVTQEEISDAVSDALGAIVLPDDKVDDKVDDEVDDEAEVGGVEESKDDTTIRVDTDADADAGRMPSMKLTDILPDLPSPDTLRARDTNGTADRDIANYEMLYLELALRVATHEMHISVRAYELWKLQPPDRTPSQCPEGAFPTWDWRVMARVALVVHTSLFRRFWRPFLDANTDPDLIAILTAFTTM